MKGRKRGWKPLRCKDCNSVISKWTSEMNKGHCSDCNTTFFINIKTGKKYEIKNDYFENPITSINGKTINLRGIWIVKGKYNDEFYITEAKQNHWLEPMADFTIEQLKQIIKVLQQ